MKAKSARKGHFAQENYHGLRLAVQPLSPPNTLTVMEMQGSNESSAQILLAHQGMQKLPSTKLEIFQLKEFLNEDMCAQLIALIEAERRPSTIADDNGDPGFRTSETCDLSVEQPVVARLDQMLCDLSGIGSEFGEPLQGQRYDRGQEFKPHTDYFSPDGLDYHRYCAQSGQRSWTFMIYLNAVEAGGATRFKALKKSFQPEAGKLLCWNNRREDGRVNPNTLHHGMKVRRGRKYVITKWYRERPWSQG